MAKSEFPRFPDGDGQLETESQAWLAFDSVSDE